MPRKLSYHHFAWIGLLLGVCIVGCEHGEKGSGFTYGDSSIKEDTTPDKTNPFIGTWKLTSSEDGSFWYAFFYNDGTWRIADNSDGSQVRVYGSYQSSGNKLNGDMVNPNVGKGAINASISGGTMNLDFVEHWHTPYKTVHYTGSKL